MAGNNAYSIISPYVQNGNPDTLNLTPPTQMTGGGYPPGSFFPYAPGDLGAPFELGDRKYQIVFCDSGATSATPTGAVAANTVAYWKDKTNRIVTNDRRFALVPGNGASNFVAGIFRVAAGAGNMIAILNKGHGLTGIAAGTVSAAGELLYGTTSAATVTGAGAGTATPYQQLGVSRTAAAANAITADIDIPTLTA